MNHPGTKGIAKLLGACSGARRISEVFDDFVAMSAISLRNAAASLNRDPQWQAREEEYLRIVGRYDVDSQARFGEAFAKLVLELESEPRDVLGEIYMGLELGNQRLGQFFTPYGVAQLVAEMTVEPLARKIREEGQASLHEPACGAAAFVIATSQALRARGVNYQQTLFVSAEDVSHVAVHMAYVHLSLLHVPAVVHRRDTLTQQTYDSWVTPALMLSPWLAKSA